MIIAWTKLGRRESHVLTYGDGADILVWGSNTGAPPPVGPPGGPGAKLVSPARITDLVRVA